MRSNACPPASVVAQGGPQTGDLAELRSEVVSLREQARQDIEHLRGLIAGSEGAIAEQSQFSAAISDARGELDAVFEQARQRAERSADDSQRRRAEALRSREREVGARRRIEVGTIMIDVRAELVSLRNELAQIGGRICRVASGAAEDRVAQTERIAEATVSTRAQIAAAEAIRDLASTANDLSRRIEQQAGTVEARERLEDVLDRLHAAVQRLRESDERTRRALRHLKAVPDEDPSAEDRG